MTSLTRVVVRSKPETKRMSRLVTMPTSCPSASTTGRPEMRNCAHSASTSSIVASGVVVIGFEIMPDSLRLTRSTCDACSWIDRLRCRMPRPPSRAIGDRHARLGDGVHRAGDERRGDRDPAGDPRRRVGLARDDVGVPGQEQDVVVGQSDEAEGVVAAPCCFLCARGGEQRCCGRFRRVHSKRRRRRFIPERHARGGGASRLRTSRCGALPRNTADTLRS